MVVHSFQNWHLLYVRILLAYKIISAYTCVFIAYIFPYTRVYTTFIRVYMRTFHAIKVRVYACISVWLQRPQSIMSLGTIMRVHKTRVYMHTTLVILTTGTPNC